MRAVLQRVRRAAVSVDDERIAEIGSGLLVLLGIARRDEPEYARGLAQKTAELRIFADDDGRFNRSVIEAGGEVLVVSQFTLLADTRKGRRPSFSQAAAPEIAEPLVELFGQTMRDKGLKVKTGRFGAHMLVDLENDGPVTVILETEAR
jgi:D-aminoacyl-tRNA deacylase